MAGDTPRPDIMALLDLISTNLGSLQARMDTGFAQIHRDMGGFGTELDGLRAESTSFRMDLNGLRNETYSAFARVDRRLDKIETRLDKIETRIDKIETRIGGLESGVGDLRSRFDAFERRSL